MTDSHQAEMLQLRDELLGPLHMHFLAAAQAYRDYLENGQSFVFACTLRRTNASARELLLRRGHLLPRERVGDAVALLRHYDVWLTCWDELAARMKPGLEDRFVFENAVTFPKDAQRRLDELFVESRGFPA